MRIVAIKGGGIRGTLAAKLGERLEKQVPGWDEGVNLYAGTSTGAILALGRAAGVTWKRLRMLYEESAARIFARPVAAGKRDRETAQAAAVVSNVINGSLYDVSPLKEALEDVFSDMKLRDLDVDVLVPAFSFAGADGREKPRALWFTRQREGNLLVVDVALASAAAPFYFPPHLGCLDGGLIANDPSVAALLHAAGGWTKLGLEYLMGRIEVLTLGCGRTRVPKGFVDMLTDGGLLGPVAGCMKALGENHRELDPRLESEIPLDGGEDPEAAVEELLAIGKTAKISGAVWWLEERGWGE